MQWGLLKYTNHDFEYFVVSLLDGASWASLCKLFLDVDAVAEWTQRCNLSRPHTSYFPAAFCDNIVPNRDFVLLRSSCFDINQLGKSVYSRPIPKLKLHILYQSERYFGRRTKTAS